MKNARARTLRNVVCFVVGLWLTNGIEASAQLTVSNAPIADAFVRANDPTHNYGGAGALEVSGSSSTNIINGGATGVVDSFVRFDVSSLVSSFNSSFGVGNWQVSVATLQLTEVGNPNNAVFGSGLGGFEIFWIADDSWVEGTGTPASPGTSGIAYTNESSVLAGGQTSLGTYSNAFASGVRRSSLSLPASFLTDISNGGSVSFFLTAITDRIGFNFNSRSFGTASARPSLELTAVAIPEPSSICLLTLSVVGLTVARRRRSR
jgi:hypothetical protein